MITKNPLLMMIALTTIVACGDKSTESDDTADNTPSGSDDTGESGEDTGDGGEDTGEITDIQTPPTPEAFNDLTLSARDDQTQVFDVLGEVHHHIEADQGSTLFFWPNSFSTEDGAPVTGEVQIELIEIFDKGSMLVTDMPSIGQRPSGEVAQLISGGEHYVGASKDGEALTMNSSFQLTAPAANTGGPDWDMGLFRAEVSDGVAADIDDQAVWIEQRPDTTDADADAEGDEFGINRGEGGGADGADTTYSILSTQFGWTNIDRWYSDPRPKTTINIDVPDGWDDTNSAVYLSYDGEATALARMDTYDDITGMFSEHYGLIPIGLQVHLIFVTESEGDWSYAIQGATIEEDHLTTFATADDFIEIDTDGLVAAINALP
jgi:hypothetical protein